MARSSRWIFGHDVLVIVDDPPHLLAFALDPRCPAPYGQPPRPLQRPVSTPQMQEQPVQPDSTATTAASLMEVVARLRRLHPQVREGD